MANSDAPLNGHGRAHSKPSVCIIGGDAANRQRLGLLLQSVGFDVHGFDSGGGLLLSGLVHRCHCLVIEPPLRGMSLAELRQALAAADVLVPLVTLPDAATLEDEALLDAVRSALASVKR